MLKKMHVSTKILTDEEQEEMGLIRLMKQTDRTKTVSRSEIMAKLGR
jgi:hypothetical protein